MKVIYKIIYGSKAFGTNDSNSDIDMRGIMLPTITEALSLKQQDLFNKENDEYYYSIQKFLRLALKSNPSVIDWLYVSYKNMFIVEKEAEILLDNKKMFLSKEIYHRTKGYAFSEFNRAIKLGDKGEKRKEIIKKFGYDTKSAMNCIRTLQQGSELLLTENLILPRPNAKELKKIKKGIIQKKELDLMFKKEMDNLEKAYKQSNLPEKVDYEKVNNLLIKIITNQSTIINYEL